MLSWSRIRPWDFYCFIFQFISSLFPWQKTRFEQQQTVPESGNVSKSFFFRSRFFLRFRNRGRHLFPSLAVTETFFFSLVKLFISFSFFKNRAVYSVCLVCVVEEGSCRFFRFLNPQSASVWRGSLDHRIEHRLSQFMMLRPLPSSLPNWWPRSCRGGFWASCKGRKTGRVSFHIFANIFRGVYI